MGRGKRRERGIAAAAGGEGDGARSQEKIKEKRANKETWRVRVRERVLDRTKKGFCARVASALGGVEEQGEGARTWLSGMSRVG